MGNLEIATALDIGTTKICAAVGYRNELGKIEILGLGKTVSLGAMRGSIVNIDKTVNSIINAIKIASTNSNVDIKIVNVGISGQYIKSSHHRGVLIRDSNNSEITKKDIEILMSDMNKINMPVDEKIIRIIPQEYTIDDEKNILDPIGMFGKRIEANFHVISSNILAINNINKCIKNANLKLQNIILKPIAAMESVLTLEEREAGVALIDIGGGTTDILIVHNNIIRHIAIIPLGGNAINNDIREGCIVMGYQAESLKLQFGNAMLSNSDNNVITSIPGLKGRNEKKISTSNLSYIIQVRIEEIIEYAYYEILNSGYEKKLLAGIVITGGTANLKNLKKLVESLTGLDTRIGYANENIICENIEDISNPQYSTVIGLVINSLNEMDKNNINVTSKNNIIDKFIYQSNWFKSIMGNKKHKLLYNDFD